jgi:hypothetical protein
MGGVLMALYHHSLHPHVAGLQGNLNRSGPPFNFRVGADVYVYIQGAFQDAVYVAQGLTNLSK